MALSRAPANPGRSIGETTGGVINSLDQRTHRVPGITAIFPAFNDAGTIASMVLSARRTIRAWTDDYEVIVVDDGSRDQTASILDELRRVVPEVRVVTHEENRGYGAALRSGFRAASKELVFYTDGDGQFDPRELDKLLEALSLDLDYVSGYRVKRADPFLRVLVGNPYHRFVRFAFGLQVKDVDCDFRLFRRSTLDAVELTETDGTMCIELLKKLHDGRFRFSEVPVAHYPRVYGRSQYFTFKGVLHSYAQLFRLWIRLVIRKRHLRPSMPALTSVPAQDE